MWDVNKKQDNGSAKYFQGTRTGINMGEKVAQVNASFFLTIFYLFFTSLLTFYSLNSTQSVDYLLMKKKPL